MRVSIRQEAEFAIQEAEAATSDAERGRRALPSALRVCLAYLAEHPADGEVPVDEEWLRAVGLLSPLSCGGFGVFLDPENQDCDIPRRALLVNTKSASLVDANNIDRVWLHLCDWSTRAQVRQLAAALGIALKEQA